MERNIKRDYNKLISTSFIRVIEKLAFMFGDEAEKEELIQNRSKLLRKC